MKELRHEGATGTVTTYKENEGYGFLSTLDVKDGGTTDVFFHISDIHLDSIAEGWRFEFDVFSSRRGFHAENLELLSKGTKEEDSPVDDRFLRSQGQEYDQTRYSPRSMKKRNKADEESEEENDEEKENKSPFKDDIAGSKNDLI